MTIDFTPLKIVILAAAAKWADPKLSGRIKAIAATLEEFWDHYSAGLNARELMLAFSHLGRLIGPNDDGRITSRRKTCEDISTWMWVAYPELENQTAHADTAKYARNWLAAAQSINLFEADNRQKAIAMTAMREAQEFLSINENNTMWRKFDNSHLLLKGTTYEFLFDCGTRCFGSLKVYNPGEFDETVQLVDSWGDRFDHDDAFNSITHYRIPAELPADA